MKKRSQIENIYKWDLTKFCKDDNEWYKQFEIVKSYKGKFENFKGKLNQKEKLLEFYNLSNEYYLLVKKLAMYASNNSNTDLLNSTYIEMKNLLGAVTSEIAVESSFYSPEMVSYPKSYFDELLQDERFKNHWFGLSNLLRLKEHVLSENEEKIVTATGTFAGEFSNIFDTLTDANIKFNKITDSKGKSYTLTTSNYSSFLTSKDRVLRKNAFNELYNQFVNFSDTIANTYIASLKADWFYSKVNKFDSVLSEHLYPDNISPNVYEKLILNVNNNLNLLHEFYKVKAKMLGLKDFTYYDLYITPSKLNKKVSFNEGVNIVKTALSVLGQDYVELIDRSVKERWIDVYPNLNKQSGAYQTGCYGITPIVLLNYKNLMDDVFTMAHELGHAMHTYYSDTNQPIELADYTIFLAEVASTVNEVLLLKYLYSKAKNKEEKIYYLDQYLQMFKGTIFRQTMFSEFEKYAHELIENNLPISKNILNNFYEQLNKKYQGTAVKHNKLINYEWLRIPHFYSPYYVYKYATGLVSAICIASNIYNNVPGSVENYKNFLKSGGSNYSVETLKVAGVNLETDQPYEIAFNEMKWAIKELKNIIKK